MAIAIGMMSSVAKKSSNEMGNALGGKRQEFPPSDDPYVGNAGTYLRFFRERLLRPVTLNVAWEQNVARIIAMREDPATWGPILTLY